VFSAKKKPYPCLGRRMSSRWPRNISISLLLLAGLVSPVACQTNDNAVIQANQEIGVSFRPSYIAYDEYSDGTVQDSEHGWIPGVGAKATAVVDALKVTNLLFGVTYDFNSGASSHRSQSLNGGSPLSYSAPFRSNDVLFRVGKGFQPIRSLLLTAEAESEFREWLRQLPEAEFAIRENYTFWALGVAFGASYNPVSSLVIKGKAGLEYTVSPVNATVGNPNGQVPNVTLGLGHRPLRKAGLTGPLLGPYTLMRMPATRGLALAEVQIFVTITAKNTSTSHRA
jgi:hypothetical protein